MVIISVKKHTAKLLYSNVNRSEKCLIRTSFENILYVDSQYIKKQKSHLLFISILSVKMVDLKIYVY